MTVEIGYFLALLAFVASLAQSGAGLWAGHKRDIRLAAAATGAAEVAFVAALGSFAILVSAFVRSDFSVENVANNSHTLKPLIYKIAGTWGNHEGSMLLWCLVACGFGAALARFRGSLRWDLRARAVGVQGLIAAMSLAYLIFASNPFVRLDPAPLQGADLNPLLQDPALAIHPPMLYFGYVGFSVVFSLAIAALLEGKVDAAWARWVRPWALASWACLTVGIALGSYWAYYELGWGGWWFWDPVENASFMPWLLGTALLHSAIVTEKRGALVSWTILLAILTFSLSLLGTFLVRSGVLTSVHAFALDPERGVWILLILGLTTGLGLALYAWRGPKLGQGSGLFAPISREGALVLNNLFLAVATATVLIGTLYPLVAESLFKQTLSVGPPYFNLTFTPIMGALFLILPLAPFMAWKRGDVAGAFQRVWMVAVLAVCGGLVTLAFTGAKVLVAIGFAIGLWLLLGALWEVAERVRMFRVPFSEVGRRFARQPRGAWGMTLAHAGLGIFVIGAVAETGLRFEQTASLQVNQSLVFAGRTVTLQGVAPVEGPNYYADRASFAVKAPHGPVVLMEPERRFYPAANMPTTEVSIRSSFAGDYYVTLGDPVSSNGVTAWTVRLYWNPLVHLIFIGCAFMTLGGVVSLFDRRLRIAAPAGARRKAVMAKDSAA